MESLPNIGAFIRPVGSHGFAYCIEVNYRAGERVQGKRWGMRAHRPYNDGHVGGACILEMTPVVAGVWKAKRYMRFGGPVYWVEVQRERGPQLDLFKAAA